MALVLIAAMGPRALAADDGEGPAPSPELPADAPPDQPPAVAAADDAGDRGEGEAAPAGADASAWTLWLVVSSSEAGATSREAAGGTGTQAVAETSQGAGVTDATADAAGQALPDQQPDPGHGCGAAGGCADGPEHQDAPAAAAAAAGGPTASGYQPPARPPRPALDPQLSPQQRHTMRVEYEQLLAGWQAAEAQIAADLAEVLRLAELHGLRVQQEFQAFETKWTERAAQREQRAADRREALARARAAQAARAALAAPRPTASFDEQVERTRSLIQQEGQVLPSTTRARALGMTRPQLEQALRYLRVEAGVARLLGERKTGPVLRPEQLARALHARKKDVIRALRTLGHGQWKTPRRMSMVGPEATPLVLPGIDGSTPKPPAVPPTVVRPPDIPRTPPSVAVAPDAVTDTPGYGGFTPETAVPAFQPTPAEQVGRLPLPALAAGVIIAVASIALGVAMLGARWVTIVAFPALAFPMPSMPQDVPWAAPGATPG